MIVDFKAAREERVKARDLYFKAVGGGYTYDIFSTSIGCVYGSPMDARAGSPYFNAAFALTHAGGIWTVYHYQIHLLGDWRSSYPQGYHLSFKIGTFLFRKDGGFIVSCSFDGTYTEIICSRYMSETLIFDPGGSSSLTTYVTAPPYYWTPNICLTSEAWVAAEHSPSDLSVVLAGRENAEIKLFQRPSSWGLGSDSWATGRIELVPPCRLSPGYYASKSETSSWSEASESNHYIEKQPSLYQLVFTQPRTWIDLGALKGSARRDPQVPIPWGDGAEIPSEGSKPVDLTTGTPLTSDLGSLPGGRMVGSWSGVFAITQLEPVDPELCYQRLITKFYQGGNEITGARLTDWEVTAVLQSAGVIYAGLRQRVKQWRSTGYLIRRFVDSHEGFSYISPRSASDLYLIGSGSVPDAGIISYSLSSSEPGADEYLIDDASERVVDFGDGELIYPYIRVLPYCSAPDRQYYLHKKLGEYYKGGLYRYDESGWTLIRSCSADLSADERGALLGRLDDKTPPGRRVTAKKLDSSLADSETLFVADLPEGYIEADTVTVTLLNGIELDAIPYEPLSPDSPIPPPPPGSTYIVTGLGDDGKANKAYLPSGFGEQDLFIGGSLWSGRFISEILYSEGSLYACEEGTEGSPGHWIRVSSGSALDLGEILTGDAGLACPPAELSSGDLWAISKTQGRLMRFARQHTGHIDKFNSSGLSVAEALGRLATASGMIIWVKPMLSGYFGIRSGRAPAEELKGYEIIEEDMTYEAEAEYDAVRVIYGGGQAQAGKRLVYRSVGIQEVTSYDTAYLLALLYKAIDSAARVELSIPIEIAASLGDKFLLPFITGYGIKSPMITMIVEGYEPDLRRKRRILRLRKQTDPEVVTP